MWRWQCHNFNVLSGWLLYSNTHPVWQSLGCLHTNILMPSYYLFNYFKSTFSLYEFYHTLRGDQKSISECWDQRERLTLPDFQLPVTDSPSISPAALTTNLFVWPAVMKQLMWAGPAHWHFIITCSIHLLFVEMDLKREILRGLINFLSSAHHQCLHFLPLYKTGSSYSNRLVLGYSK